MANTHHREILEAIEKNSGVPTQHTELDTYLGTTSPRYPISVPELRKIAKGWMERHHELESDSVAALIASLIRGQSSTEKTMAGILLDYATASQRKFNPVHFDIWLSHLTGWAEVDSLCAGKFTGHEITEDATVWKKILVQFASSKNIQKRRASLVMLVAPLRHGWSPVLADLAFSNIDRVKHEKEILITKAVSWLLRSMIKHHRPLVESFLEENKTSLPAIAIRETLTKLSTGRKGKNVAVKIKRRN